LILWLAGRRVGGDLEESEPLRWVSGIAPRPLLIIHGENDPYVSVEDARRLYDRAGQPKELWIAPGAGHRRVDEVYPDEYRDRVVGFFDRYLAGTADGAQRPGEHRERWASAGMSHGTSDTGLGVSRCSVCLARGRVAL
ncbi:MAG TPA: alpha/beta hydrolase, partial [Chloroflexi bacterium]|nr:alpha/beta hydrolase [Chloroflexota bacterium]